VHKVRKSSSRIKFRLRELNLKLIRLFIFNQVFRKFASFYGSYLNKILYIISNLNNFRFKFCFITNNSVNARFLTRYMGLKLKKKFPLFFVINPLKKEFRKLSEKKREKKKKVMVNYFGEKPNFLLSYKKNFYDILYHMQKRYKDLFLDFYISYKTLITYDIYAFFLMLKKRHKYHMLLMFYKQKFRKNLKVKI
jgi:hypothetical protein